MRFKTCHAGRRSFKTEIGKRTVVSSALGESGESFFLGAPTRDQSKKIFWDDVKKMSPKFFTKTVSDSELYIRYINDSELWVLGFDKPERFEGKRWRGGMLTEFPHFKSSAWDETIMPALRDTKGWCILEGVPQGAGDRYQELCEYAKISGDKEWADYQWSSIDVMDADEVLKEKARLDERTFKQEYEGSFETYEGRVYCYYNSDVHCVEKEFNPSLPITISCDFNKDPCIWVFGQETKNYSYEFNEICQRNTDTWKMCNGTKDKLTTLFGDKVRAHKIIFYGDYTSAKTRDVSAIASSWEIIRGEFRQWNVEFKLKGNPRVMDRVNAFNSRLRTADGQTHWGHSKNCIELRKDMERVDWEMIKKETGTGDRTHASDAVGYKINYEYPVLGNEMSRLGNE